MGYIIFNGRSSKDFGIEISSPPDYIMPSKNVNFTDRVYRNGSLINNYNTFNNIDIIYHMSLPIVDKPYSSYVSDISSWLNEPTGYSELEDSYNPDIYRLAAFNGNVEFTNVYDEAIVFDLSFSCKPEKFLKQGSYTTMLYDWESGFNVDLLDPIDSSEVITLYNPTGYKAKPIYKMKIKHNEYHDAYIEMTVFNLTNPYAGASMIYNKATIKINNSSDLVVDSNNIETLYFDTDTLELYYLELNTFNNKLYKVKQNHRLDYLSLFEYGVSDFSGDFEGNTMFTFTFKNDVRGSDHSDCYWNFYNVEVTPNWILI